MPIPAGLYVPPPYVPPTVPLSAYRPTTTPLRGAHVALDGWAGPAVDGNGTEWWPTVLDGWWGGVDLRTAVTARPADHGGFDGESFLGARALTISGVALPLTENLALIARDSIVSLCSDLRTLHTIVVTESSGLAKQANVRMAGGVKVGDLNGVDFEWQISLVAPDPRRYDVNETTLTISAPHPPTGGLVVPLTVPFTINTTGASAAFAAATNIGTVATRPVVTFAGPLANPQVTNSTTGKTLALTTTIADGEFLTLDFDRRSVLLNDLASRASAISAGSAWWEIVPGDNKIQLSAAGGDGTATVRFRSAWR